MAYFPDSELIASIRHELRIEDDSGTCARLLPPVEKRAKYGCLPLNFRITVNEEDEDASNFEYPLNPDVPPVPTSEVIKSRLRSRTTDSDMYANVENLPKPEFDTSFFLNAAAPHREEEKPVTSAVSRNLTSEIVQRNNWAEFGKFEVFGDGPSRKLMIIFMMDVKSIALTINVLPSTKVSQVIGVACMVYAREKGIVLSGVPSDYQLYMADESGDIDSDFPPLETSRPIRDLGFNALALARKEDSSRDTSHTITVYFTTGESFNFHLSHLDHTLAWLRGQAIEKKLETLSDEQREQFMLIPDYHIETTDSFDVRLKPDQSIASTQATEFVLVRRNSSRAGYHPHGIQQSPQNPLMLTTPSILKSPEAAGSTGRFDFPKIALRKQSSVATLTSPPPRPSISESEYDNGEALKEWKVEKLHKFKAKWSAKLVLHLNRLEICPLEKEEKRRSIMGGPIHKSVTVPWENVCDVAVSERKANTTNASTDTVPIVMIYTLPLMDQRTINSVLGLQVTEIRIQDIPRLYENTGWKVYQLECTSREEAREIAVDIQGICRVRETTAFKIFSHSAGGARRPAAAADAAMLHSTEGPLSGVQHRKKNKFAGTIRRMLSSNKE